MQTAGKPSRKFRGLLLIMLLTLAYLGWLYRPIYPSYTITDFGTLSGNPNITAAAINNQGQILGNRLMEISNSTPPSAFLYHDGVLMKLVTPYNASANASAINDKGQITGFVGISPTRNQAFFYSSGQFHPLGNLPGYDGSYGNCINNQGQIVGALYRSNLQIAGTSQHAFLYSGGRMTVLKLLPGKPESQASGINTQGQVVGDCTQGFSTSQAFLYDSTTRQISALPMPRGYTNSHARGINDLGEVIGDIDSPQTAGHAALWQGGQVKDLGTTPGTEMSMGLAINRKGQAVGISFHDFHSGLPLFLNFLRRFSYFRTATGHRTLQTAWVYRDGKLSDLNELIPRNADWTLENARAINNSGQIVGQGLHHGQERAFLLTPTR